MEPLEIQIRHDGTRSNTTIDAVRVPTNYQEAWRAAFHSGLKVGTPLLSRLDFSVDVGNDPTPAVVATFDAHATSIEIIADLVDPIPGLDVKRVYVLSNGLAMSTHIRDADTGQGIDCAGVQLVLTRDCCRAQLLLLDPTALGPWEARRHDMRWCAVEVVEREFHRDGADLTAWRALVDGDEECDLREFNAWRPVPAPL